MNVDLPNLTSIINSRGDSFHWPRLVTLESISEYWILMVFRYSKSSKCQSTWWLFLSIRVCSIEINFEYCLIDLISFIDVSPSSTKSIILICSVIIHWLGTFGWNVCLFVSNRFLIPMHDSIIIQISILSAWLYCFSLPFLQWYSIKIDVSINQPFMSKIIMLFITNDTSIIYWTFTNDDDCNLPIIAK